MWESRSDFQAWRLCQASMAPDIRTIAGTRSLGDDQWPAVFQDPALAQLIHEALTNSLDLQIAARRVLKPELRLGLRVPSNSRPSAPEAATAHSSCPQASQARAATGRQPTRSFMVEDRASPRRGNLDFWGLYRRQTEAARAELPASEWGQKTVQSTLMLDVELAYFNLRALDTQ